MIVNNQRKKMIMNVKTYKNKIRKLKENFFFSRSVEDIKGKKKGFGTPVIIFDQKNNKYSEHISIAEAARYLNTYPNAVLRRIQDNKPYKERFLINTKPKRQHNRFLYYTFVSKYTFISLTLLINNIKTIFYSLLSLLMGICLSIYFPYIAMTCKDIYDDLNIENIEYSLEDIEYPLDYTYYSLENIDIFIKNIFETGRILASERVNGLAEFNKE
jgi:hypothetical protein